MKKDSGFLEPAPQAAGKKRQSVSTPCRESHAIQKELKSSGPVEQDRIMGDRPASAGCFGRLMAELMVWKKDQWEETLRTLGFFLGKFIYIMDAYDDLEKDLKEGNYNPLRTISEEPDYHERCRDMLCMMIAECSAQFEKLPCILDIDILRNILYDGAGTDSANRKRTKRKKKSRM